MRQISLLLMLLLFILSCSKKETTEPAPTTGTISGTVMNKAGDAAVPAAIVTTEPPTSSVSTDNQGKYTIEEVDPGDYIVQAVKDGFDPGNVNVTVKAGKTVTADIRMGILLANHPPTKPQLLAPENNSQYQSIDLQLQWKEAADPDGDAVV
ncbi:carboxypeptidase-like regulatory domain-containing protein [Calditrichota bacterium GD2]